MSPILAIINLLFIVYAAILLWILSKRFRLYFLIGAIFPLLVVLIATLIFFETDIITPANIGLFFLRGGLIASILCGSLVNFFISYYQKKKQ